uniref:Rab3 GTPase-activating protein catalytic subunit n=1 Tax=Anopheles atroparvus TaxID=41427 RepID=A0A182IXZ7_ANOAO
MHTSPPCHTNTNSVAHNSVAIFLLNFGAKSPNQQPVQAACNMTFHGTAISTGGYKFSPRLDRDHSQRPVPLNRFGSPVNLGAERDGSKITKRNQTQPVSNRRSSNEPVASRRLSIVQAMEKCNPSAQAGRPDSGDDSTASELHNRQRVTNEWRKALGPANPEPGQSTTTTEADRRVQHDPSSGGSEWTGRQHRGIHQYHAGAGPSENHRVLRVLSSLGAYDQNARDVDGMMMMILHFAGFLFAQVDPTGVAGGFPDSRTCLLHQKLQMLNVCMERRTLREGGLPFSMTSSAAPGVGESDEEFFDCSDEEEGRAGSGGLPEPVGRLSRLGKMLLVGSDEPLYIPVTQEPVPKTEDQLEDDAEVMLKLGPGSELCTQMMSASLLSDMESFKAANLAAGLEDFIRWYSPRDWIEDEPVDEQDPFGRRGHLSSRMLIPGNTWQTVWESARAVPARRQKRLFDDTKEAEKVLHFLESRTIGQIAQLSMATLFHVALLTLSSQTSPSERDAVPRFAETFEKLTASCCKLSREAWAADGPRISSAAKYEQLLGEMMQLECVVTQVRSLQRKLFDAGESSPELVQRMLQAHETELPEGAGSAMARRLVNMFAEAKGAANEQQGSAVEHHTGANVSLPDPIEKQFTLRLSGETITILRQMTTAARADWLRIRCNIRQRQLRHRNHVNAHGPVHQAKERKLAALLKLHQATTAAERASARQRK